MVVDDWPSVLDCRSQSIRLRQKHDMEWSKKQRGLRFLLGLRRRGRGFAALTELTEQRLLQVKKAAKGVRGRSYRPWP